MLLTHATQCLTVCLRAITSVRLSVSVDPPVGILSLSIHKVQVAGNKTVSACYEIIGWEKPLRGRSGWSLRAKIRFEPERLQLWRTTRKRPAAGWSPCPLSPGEKWAKEENRGHDGKTASQERLEYSRALSEIAFGSVGGLNPLCGRFPVMNSKQISSVHWKAERPVRSDGLRRRRAEYKRRASSSRPRAAPRASTSSDSCWSSNWEMYEFNRSYINYKVMQHWISLILLETFFCRSM